jgi:hypothetical protein
MDKCEFFLVSHTYDGQNWEEDELVEESPLPRVREILGGQWERASTYHPMVSAFFNGEKRVLVIGFPPGKTKEEAVQALKQIHSGREDTN